MDDEWIDVVIVQKINSTTVVVEYSDADALKRTIVPATVVRDGRMANIFDLAAGEPFGEPWEHMVMLRQVTPLMYANALRKRGIWTKDDLLAKPALAMAAIQEVHGVELSHLLTSVKGR